MTTDSPATITTVAAFPEHTMLENLAVRADGSILVVASPQRQVWYAPASTGGQPVEPALLYTFEDAFNYPQRAGMSAPSWMSRRRDSPRHMTIFPGGGSLARAR
jgi:hypothetical protein